MTATHAREQILEQAFEIVAGITDFGDNAYRQRAIPFNETDIPACSVEYDDETSEVLGESHDEDGSARESRTIEIAVSILATSPESRASLDLIVESHIVQAQKPGFRRRFLRGNWKGGLGARLLYGSLLIFEVVYDVNRIEPDVIL